VKIPTIHVQTVFHIVQHAVAPKKAAQSVFQANFSMEMNVNPIVQLGNMVKIKNVIHAHLHASNVLVQITVLNVKEEMFLLVLEFVEALANLTNGFRQANAKIATVNVQHALQVLFVPVATAVISLMTVLNVN